MGSYFKPLRRKVGVVVLVMACVLTVEWMRSHTIGDSVNIPIGKHCFHTIASMEQSIVWATNSGENVATGFGWNSDDFSDAEFPSLVSSETNEWISIWRWHGFGRGEIMPAANMGRMEWWFIPYWSIILPLCLTSAWLLLSKSRMVESPQPRG